MAKPGITDMRTEPYTSSDLYICNGEDLKEFWRSILPEFLRVVDPRESGFMDTLIASELLTDTDLESLSGKDVLVRKDQARKLWFILSQFSLNEFITKVAPDLCEKYYHIIPKKFLATKEQRSQMMTEVVTDDPTKNNCQRHTIERRVRLVTLADLLFHHKCLQFDDYGEIVCKSANKPATEGLWNKIFTAFSAAPGGALDMLEAETRKMLKRYNVFVSAELRDLLLRGFPCTCANTPTSPPTNPDNRVKRVWSWLLKKMDYSESSPDSTITNADASSYNPSSTIRAVSASDSESLCSEITIINKSTALPEPVLSVRKRNEVCGEINHSHTVESTEYTGQNKAVVTHVNNGRTLQNGCDKKTSSKKKPIKLIKRQEKSSGYKAKLPGEAEISPRLDPPVIKEMDNVNLKNFITLEPSAFTTIEMEPFSTQTSKDSAMASQKGPISMPISKDKVMTTELETGPSFRHISKDKVMTTELETGPSFRHISKDKVMTIELETGPSFRHISKDKVMTTELETGPSFRHISKDKVMTTELETGPSFRHISKDKVMTTELETRPSFRHISKDKVMTTELETGPSFRHISKDKVMTTELETGPSFRHISKDKVMTTELETGPSFRHISEDKAMATELETRLFLTPILDTEEANLTKLSVANSKDNQMAMSSFESTIFNQEAFDCKQNSSTCRQNAPYALGAQESVETGDTLANARNIGLMLYSFSFISWLLYLALSALKLVPFIIAGIYQYAVLEFALDFSRLLVLVSTLSIVRQINWNWYIELIKKLLSTFDVLSDTKVAPAVEVECEESRL